MEEYSQLISTGLIVAMLTLSITAIFCLIRAVKGPRLADRLVAVNMIGIKVMILIILIGTYIGERYITDVAIVYALLSFLAVVVFSKYALYSSIKSSKKDISKEEVKEVGDRNGIS